MWVLQNGEPAPARIVIGASDGKRTVVASGELKLGQALIVDQITAKK